MTAWRLWDVTVGRWPPVIVTAPTRGKAMSAAWRFYLSYDDRATFIGFARMTRVRLRRAPPVPDGYDGVRRQYGVDPRIGQRVRLLEGGRREGTVIYPGPSTCYVHVVLDGDDSPVVVHPSYVALSAAGAAA